MRISKLAFSAAFITVLSTSTSLISPAMAQKGRFLEPSTAWAVTKVGKNQGQGSEYCALARRFEEKTIMTMAKNANSETSFALDFQSAILAAGRDTEVILDPGAGQQRSYNVQPVSDKAFVIRLGNDDEFFQALGRTGYLRVEVGNHQYSFNLQDIDTGKGQLEACIAASVMPAAGEMFYDVNAPKQTPNIPAVTKEQDEFASLRAEIERLREKQAEISNLVTVSGAEVKKEIDASAETEVKSLKDQLASLQGEKDNLMMQLAAATEQSQAAIDNGASAETVLRLEKENDQLRQMAREFEVRLSEHSALVSEIEGLRKSNSDLRTALDQSRALSDEEKAGTLVLKDTLATLELQNTELEAQLETAKAGLMNFAAQVSEIEETKKQNAELTQKIAEAAERQKEFDSTSQKLTALEVEKAKLENSVREIEQKTSMDMQLKKELESSIALLESENNRLQGELQRASQSGAQLDLLTSQITLLEQENEKLSVKLKETDGRYKGNLADKDKAVAELEQKIVQLSAEKSVQDQQLIELSALSLELDTLRKQNAELEGRIQGSAQTEQVVAELRQQVETLAQGNEGLKLEIEKVRTEKKGEYALQLDKLTAENEQLLQQIESQKTALADLDALKKDFAGLQSEKSELLEKIKRFEVSQSDSVAQLEELLRANESLQFEIDSLAFVESDSLKALAEEKSSLAKDLEARQQEIAKLESRIKDQEKESSVADEIVKVQFAQQEKAIAELKAQIAEKSEKIAAFEAGAVDGAGQVSALETRIAQLEDSAWSLQADLADKEGAINTLEQALEQEKKSVVALEASLSEKMSYIEPAAAEMKIEEAQGEASEIAAKLEAAIIENTRLQEEMQGLRDQEMKAQEQFALLQQENETFERQVAELEAIAGIDGTDDEQLAALRAQMEDMLTQNNNLRARIVDLETAAKAQSQEGADVASLSPDLEALKAENAQLKEQLAKYESDMGAVAQLEDSLRQAEMENTKLREELEQKTAAIEKLEAENAALIADAAQGIPEGVQPVSQVVGDSADLEDARRKIAALEKSLAQSDREKQRALEDLAESYLKLTRQSPQLQPASMKEVRAEPLRQEPARVSGDQAPRTASMAGGDKNDMLQDQVAQAPAMNQAPKKTVQAEVLPMPAHSRDSANGNAAPSQNSQTGHVAQIDQDAAPVRAPEPQYASSDIEAQMYEQQEMQAIRSNQRVDSTRSAAAAQQNVAVRRSEDPFADIEVIDDFSGYSTGADGNLQEQRQQAAAPRAQEVMREALPEVAQTAAPRSMVQDTQTSARASAPANVRGVYHPSFTIEDVLRQADIGSNFNVRMVEKASSADKAAYEWQAGGVFGTAELTPLMNDAGFEQAVQTYLERTQSRCNGDFAIVPDDTQQSGEMRVDSYEVACVGDNVHASASLLFFNKSGTFAVLTHEADLEYMESAMNMRDKIMRTIAGS